MSNESNQISSQFSKALLISGGIGLILIAIIIIIVIIIYCNQSNQYNPSETSQLSSKSNQFNIAQNSNQKEHYEFRTLQNTSVQVIKETPLSEVRNGSLNVDLSSMSQKKSNTNTLQTKTSQMVEEVSFKKAKPISFRSDYSDDQVDNKDLEKAIDKEINKYIPHIQK